MLTTGWTRIGGGLKAKYQGAPYHDTVRRHGILMHYIWTSFFDKTLELLWVWGGGFSSFLFYFLFFYFGQVRCVRHSDDSSLYSSVLGTL